MPKKTKIDKSTYVNCKDIRPANYKGYEIRKEILKKLVPSILRKTTAHDEISRMSIRNRTQVTVTTNETANGLFPLKSNDSRTQTIATY